MIIDKLPIYGLLASMSMSELGMIYDSLYRGIEMGGVFVDLQIERLAPSEEGWSVENIFGSFGPGLVSAGVRTNVSVTVLRRTRPWKPALGRHTPLRLWRSCGWLGSRSVAYRPACS